MVPLLLLVIFVSAAAHIRAEYRGPHWQVYLFKPLTTLLILGIAALGQETRFPYQKLLLIGLGFSLVGDILLMLPGDRFLAGLVAFLLAHCSYSTAFGFGLGSLSGWVLIPLLLFGLAVYQYLSPALGKMRLPVLCYMGIILAMAWLAWERFLGVGGTGPLLAGIGAVLFVLSDALLAVGRYKTTFPALRAFSLGTYFTGQLLIAGSAGALVF